MYMGRKMRLCRDLIEKVVIKKTRGQNPLQIPGVR